MQQHLENPYITCPTFETDQFAFRMVRSEDAQDLLECYSDPLSAKIFNSDKCTSDFVYHTLDEMQNCIRFWLEDYERAAYIRLSILDKARAKAVGTIEFFAKPGSFEGFGRVGLLRLDLASRYENLDDIAEILRMVEDHFYSLFDVDSIITKAVPEAKERIRALETTGYRALPGSRIVPYNDYYGKVK